ncbi:class III poly(R)-hydroxyalkanoic acid synthase subunit PhaC [Haloferax mediterranei ATCC 33500]|uniref:Poly(3-hydroxyalkanoate) polymerase subunit PhaC n=2 Tax=Haloferax mediterranei TaxID=2252 RepID=I3R7Z6_HALMT|nr:class III poly(R)-hydroxyalkanoic acid synthase subunit PhaC [Haloferax mediterranei]ADY18552.1 PhaC1 [Haloferax mediterranei]AFK20356.1 poly(3-hydroxyalkanoate) synthase subunit PhaC [Haloferax mediterranei ATCC 33500]AHZ23723.1 poly (3-hydroxybutyrate) depolymerase [Haloferax mediterranei ATCC 33500]ELZ99211.1 poly(3-hydroxyalkanoate) synthase subunit PhaC [Haloferax mediterranei ATCC 33500]MDX5986889.1 class III poly(R)-hydroxyalkanoic acid synthase subunit PhaC [Haloferax mediterranei A
MTMNPFTTALDIQRQTFERGADTIDKMRLLPERLDDLASVEVGQTPSEVIHSENKLDLLHYEPLNDDRHNTPLLVVYALINRPYILDLQPDKSVVRRFLEDGFDVYLIDWGEPSRLDASLTLGDYVNRYIDNCVDVVRDQTGADSINVLGYCMGGTISTMYAALYPEKVNNLGLMATGLCFNDTGGILERWGSEDYFDPKRITETYGNVPSEFLATGFAQLNLIENALMKYGILYDHLDDKEAVENFGRMERWVRDGVDVAGEAYRQFIEDIYQDNALYRNELVLDGDHVDIENLTMPVLQIVGSFDHLIPPGASKPFSEVIPSEDTDIYEFPTGHVGMAVSGKSHGELWPRVATWFRERSTTQAVSPDTTEREEAQMEAEQETSLQTIDGIGPTYEERLRDAGITTVGQLATAEAATLADRLGVSESRVTTWMEQARQRTS